MSVLFCNIAWMEEYRGQYNKKEKVVDQPIGGGEYVHLHGEAHESCNFLEGKDNLVYGHVETWRGGDNGYDTEIRIESLGAKKSDKYIDGIDVIWIAKHPSGGKRVVGWYRNARIYRHRQSHNGVFPTKQHSRDSITSYRIVSSERNVQLVNEDERTLQLDRSNRRTGWPGRSAVFFPAKHKDNLELRTFLKDLYLVMKGSAKINTNNDEEYFEGDEKLGLHRRKERSSNLVRAFKNQLKDYSCTVCSFSFEETYGALGNNYIEAHHIKPISEMTERTKMVMSDLVAVCSNCHRMLHRSTEITNVEQLENIFSKNFKK